MDCIDLVGAAVLLFRFVVECLLLLVFAIWGGVACGLAGCDVLLILLCFYLQVYFACLAVVLNC